MTTVNISKYISDTKQNILSSGASENTFAHAVDTNELLLKLSTGWTQWRFDDSTGVYQLPDTDIVTSGLPLTHIDVSDTRTGLINHHNLNARDTKTDMARVTPQIGGWIMTKATNSNMPTLHDNLLNGKPGIKFLNKDSLITHDIDVRQRVYHGSFTMFMVFKLHKYWNEWGDNTLQNRIGRTLMGTLWGSSNAHMGQDNSGGQTIGAWFDHNVNTDIHLRPMGSGLIQSHYVRIRNSNEPYLSGHDLMEIPIVLCMHYGSSYNGVAFADESTNVDVSSSGGSIISMSICNYQNYAWSSTSSVHTLNGLRIGGYGGFDLGEFILYNNTLPRDEVNHIGAHLANKWGSVWNQS